MNRGAVVRRCCHSEFDDDAGVGDVGVEGRKIAGRAAGGDRRQRPAKVGVEVRNVGQVRPQVGWELGPQPDLMREVDDPVGLEARR